VECKDLTKMVSWLAKGFDRQVYGEMDREDLFQEGMLGLMEASERYQPDRGASMATFGARRAVGAMKDQIRDLARRSREQPVADLDASPFSAATGIQQRHLESQVRVIRFGEFLRNEWKRLTKRHQAVLHLRYFEGASVREVGMRFRVSSATASRWEHQALDCLREALSGYRL